MPELTVLMPAYNAGKRIKKAVESVLRQDGADFELIVVDDGSQDDTAEAALCFKDPRVRLIRNERSMGAAYCYNLAVEESRSPFIAHTSPDVLALPGAFQKMIASLKSSPDAGQVNCCFFRVDEDWKITRDSFRRQRKRFLENITPDMDYKKGPLLRMDAAGGLRAYRKEVFDAVGKFDGAAGGGEVYDMALRITEKYDIILAPEFLYCVRNHGDGDALFPQYREPTRRQKLSGALSVSKDGGVRSSVRKMISDLCSVSWLPGMSKRIAEISGEVCDFIVCRVLTPVGDRIYVFMDSRFSDWPINLFSREKQNKPVREKSIAYYLWHYPILSETFIRREVAALKKSGLSVQVVADAPDDLEFLEENAAALVKDTRYLYPMHKELGSKYFRHFFLKNPLLFINLFLYVLFHKYHISKNLGMDVEIFMKSVYLAGVLKDMNVNHVHSPWSDVSAFVSLVASRLLGVPYTVQARAHEVHRKTYLYGLTEKFMNAEFVVTNTRYNESHLKSFLNGRSGEKIHTIYNGLDLERFKPKPRRRGRVEQVKILSVARLIEQKGLVYLLGACKILKERGYKFRCEIIGAPEAPLYTNYFVRLKKLHRQLGLEDCVHFRGAQPFDRVLEAYRDADIFVLPCVIAEDGSRDITPNALIEAMAMKLPVVSTNITGIPEIVEDGVSGILLSPRDESALAEAVIKLIDDHDFRKKLGENARKRVEERFDINKNIVRYAELFGGRRGAGIQENG